MKRLLPLIFVLGVATPAIAAPVVHEPTMVSVGLDEPTLVAQTDAPKTVQVEPFVAPTETKAPAEQPAPQPSDSIDNPLDNPLAAYDDIKAAKRIGWGAVFLVGLIMLCGILARLGGVFSPLAKPRVLLAVGSLGTFAATTYNAVALGGAWVAALAAAVPPLIAVMVKVWQWEPAKTEAA